MGENMKQESGIKTCNQMEYLRRLIQETDYLERMKELETLEQDRKFCRHGLQHVLDVARLAWIKVLEEQQPVEKEQLYLTALLHDMGRIAEYRQGIPHHEAGIIMARNYLQQIGYPQEKCELIFEAIQEHRNKEKLNKDFISIIKQADNQSRNCFFCEAGKECKWSEEQKNYTVVS